MNEWMLEELKLKYRVTVRCWAPGDWSLTLYAGRILDYSVTGHSQAGVIRKAYHARIDPDRPGRMALAPDLRAKLEEIQRLAHAGLERMKHD